ncbi:MAG: ECF transporter S component [Clostridia bacterium]|nr:ECF transporter S component [Clostridia bacterium]
MKKGKLFKVCCAAVFAALICIFTFAFPVPLPNKGYFNFGDCFIIVAALCLGPVFGGLAAGIGAGLADLILGYTYYAPATFVIKWLMVVACWLIYKAFLKLNKKLGILGIIVGAIIAEIVMILGYFLFEIPLYGLGVAIADIIGNATQGAIGAVSGSLLFIVLEKTGAVKKLFRGQK